MVLSLPFVLALIGSATGLLVGMLIFGDITEAIECPASGGGGGSGVLFDTLGATSDGIILYPDIAVWAGQLVATTGQQITSVTINDIDMDSNGGTLTAEIWTDATTDIDSSTLVATSDNQLTLTDLGEIVDFTWTFTPAVTVNDPNTLIAIHIENWDSTVGIPTSSSNVGIGVIWDHLLPTSSGFFTPLAGFYSPSGYADMLMRVETAGGGPAETGAEQCQQAKDISWTVIGIIPVALFFSLFAIFSALGTGRQS